MEKFQIDIFRELPTETKRNIISFISDPDEIISLGSQSLEFKELLYEGVTDLRTEKNPYYLDIDWLTNYPMLQEVSDNIIFRFTLGNELNFRIPYCLKKFNFAISYVIDDETLLINTLSYLFNQLRDDKKVCELDECTIRVMINDATDNYKDTAFVIDKQNISLFPILDINSLRSREMFKIESICQQLEIDYPYYKMGTGWGFLDSLNFVTDCYYPTPLFKQFIDDISPEIGLDLKSHFLKGYMKTSIYIIVSIYATKVAKFSGHITNLTKADLIDYKIHDYLITDYCDDVVKTLKRKFKPSDRNVLISHLYLTEPSIYQSLKSDLDLLLSYSDETNPRKDE